MLQAPGSSVPDGVDPRRLYTLRPLPQRRSRESSTSRSTPAGTRAHTRGERVGLLPHTAATAAACASGALCCRDWNRIWQSSSIDDDDSVALRVRGCQLACLLCRILVTVVVVVSVRLTAKRQYQSERCMLIQSRRESSFVCSQLSIYTIHARRLC